MLVWLDLFDNHGEYQQTLNGVSIAGPVRGIRDVSWTPRGARLNLAGELTFSLALATRRATAINEGTFLRLWQDGIDQGLFIVGDDSETDDGTVATFRCSDLMDELRWSLLTGYANDPAVGIDENVNTIIGQVQDYSHTLSSGYWSMIGVPGTVGFYSGTSFLVEADSTLGALSNLSTQTGYGFRLHRLTDRVLDFGDLRGDSGIRLQRAAGNASASPPAYIRPITELVPKRDAQSIVTIVAPQAQGADGANLRDLWNETGEQIVPNTNTQWHVTGAITDPWYDPEFPLTRRRRPDFKATDGQDGWTYFVVNTAARVTQRERWQSQVFGDIRPATAFFSDRRFAAAALYRACVAFLQARADAHRILDVTTTAIGDNRGLAGADVQVVDFRRAINELRTVIDVTRSVSNDGIGTDRWLVDNIGRPARGDRVIVGDTWRQMVALATNPRPIVYSRVLTYAGHVPRGQSLPFTIPALTFEHRVAVFAHIAPGKDEAGSTPDTIALIAGGYYFGVNGTQTNDAFDADISYTNGDPAVAGQVPAVVGQPLGVDSLHDLVCTVPVDAPGNITATITIHYTGSR
jgi:hypothetical protein